MEELTRDYKTAPMSDAERSMLDYCVKLTLTPWDMIQDDVAALRAAGWNDTAILDINQVTGYYAYVNRLADGLGVELESILDEDSGGSEAEETTG